MHIYIHIQIGRMSCITSLRVDGNDIRTPPPYICDLETKAMLRFLDRVDQCISSGATSSCSVLQCVAVCCSVLQCVAL